MSSNVVPLMVLIVDHQQPDAELTARHIALGSFPNTWPSVETQILHQIREFQPELNSSDFP